MQQLANVHRIRAAEIGKPIRAGYPRWNDGDVVDGPVQEFHFYVGYVRSHATFGSADLERYADADPQQREALDDYARRLCGTP